MLHRILEHAQKSTLAGLLFRLVLLTIVQTIVLLFLMFGATQGWSIGKPEDILIVFMVVVGFQIAGQMIAERPEGIEYAYLRLGGSIAARTVFPLVMLLGVDFLIEPGFIENTMVPLLSFYFVGMIFGIGLHLAHLNKQDKPAS